MLEKELGIIQAAEKDAEELIKNAEAESRRIVAAAREEAAKIRADAAEEGDRVFRGFAEQGAAAAEQHYKTSMEETAAAREAVMEHARGRVSQAVQTIVERIVMTSGNR